MENGTNGRLRSGEYPSQSANPRNGAGSSKPAESADSSKPSESSNPPDPPNSSNPPDLPEFSNLTASPDPPNSATVPDLIDTLRRTKEATGHGAEATIGGYAAEHDRPAAFEGSDGQPYTVDVAAAPSGEPELPYAAFLLFVRWAMTGAGIMGHIESGDVAHGSTEEEALRMARELTLYEAKVELDAAIERRAAEAEE